MIMSRYLIIGATSGMGLSVVKRLAKTEHKLFITGRSHAIETIANEYSLPHLQLDASDFNATDLAFEEAVKKIGPLDGVVNFAGSLLLKPAHATSFNEYMETINANLTTAFSVVRAAGHHMKHTGGSVVLISSAAALIGVPNHEAIAAAKAGILGLVFAAAATYAPSNLRFNAIAPGLVQTSMTSSLTNNDASIKACELMHPLGRIGKVEDIASAILFFLSPENDWITGQCLAVDGGLSHVRSKIKFT